MKKTISIIGIIAIIIGIICLLYAGLNWFAFKNTLDASNDFYHNKQQQALLFLIIGLAVTAIGVICCIFRNRIGK